MRSALDFATPPPPPPPPPPLPPPFQTVAQHGQGIPSSSSYSPSLIIITGIIAFVIIVSACIHLLLRFLSRRSSSAAPFSSPQQGSSRSSSAASTSWPPDRDRNGLAESLPLFSLASSLASVPRSSPDCAVCLSAFRPHDELRLLPACRHAFHAACIDTWLRSTPSCPLCRSSVSLLPPSAPPAPPAQPATEEARGSSGTSFRIEIGSVSRRSTQAEEDSISASSLPPRHPRTYSLGSSFEYVVEEEVEAVLARIRRRPDKVDEAERGGPPPPGAEIAEAAGGGGRGWLKEYVDRLASSASSSFNSLRFSGRWSHRFDGGNVGVGGGRRESWDSELEEGGLSTFYRWLMGS